MFIFGGKGANGAMYNDVFFLDLVEWVWVPVSPLSVGPSPRFFHAAELVGRKIVVHGGWDGDLDCFNDLWIFNTDSFAWMQPRTSGFGPTPRYGHSLNLAADGRLLAFGGCTLTEKGLPKYLDDMRVIDTETMVWTRPRLEGLVPSARFGHTTGMAPGDQLVLFGGWGRGGCQSSTQVREVRGCQYSFFLRATT
jgi:host cell factor